MTNKICRIIHRFISRKFKVTILKNYPRYSEKVILKELGKDLVGVEIGVGKGKHAERMLKKLPIKKLYLVDVDECIEAQGRVYRFNDKIKWIIKKSAYATKDIPNNLDFVYIDGSHSYKDVKKDLERYYPKLKEGGILCGHDFGQQPVGKAVWEFSVKINKLFEMREWDWLIRKTSHNPLKWK